MNTKNAFLLSFLEKYISIGMQIITSIILARLISPAEFGVFSLCIFLITLASVIKEFGVGNYIVKEDVLDDEKLSSCFSVLAFFALFSSFLIFLTAAPFAKYYENPQLEQLVKILILNILISPFGSIVLAVLQKEMKFKQLAFIRVVSGLIGSSSSIGLALYGGGVYALVIGSVISTLTLSIVAQAFKTRKIKGKGSINKCIEIIQYSKYVVGSSIIFEASGNLSQLVIGKIYSFSDVGLFSRAETTAALFKKLIGNAVSPVVMPLIAASNSKSETNNNIEMTIRKVVEYFTFLAFPFYLCLATLSEPAIIMMFGEQWSFAGVFLTFLCIDRFIGSLVPMMDAIFHGLGHAKQLMYTNLIGHTSRVITILLTYQYGLTIMVLAMSLVTPVVGNICKLYMIDKILNISAYQLFKFIKKPLLQSLVCVMPCIFSAYLHMYLQIKMSTSVFLITGILSALLWLHFFMKSELKAKIL